MSKYDFRDLDPNEFERLVQALVEARFGAHGQLTQFGPGKDGGREATWIQEKSHPTFSPPRARPFAEERRWLFQAKYHDVTLNSVKACRETVVSDLASELDKVTRKHQLNFDKYVLATNIPFSGVRHSGTRDRIEKIREKWAAKAEIEVWDASDISRMLDNAPHIRKTYLARITPSDILSSLLQKLDRSSHSRDTALRAFLISQIRHNRHTRSDEATDARELAIDEIFVDLAVRNIGLS